MNEDLRQPTVAYLKMLRDDRLDETVDIPNNDKLFSVKLLNFAIKELEKQQNIGHWIDKFGGVYRCSQCKKLFSESDVSDTLIKNWKYCPKCGQKKLVK